jgi:hypothetical protein
MTYMEVGFSNKYIFSSRLTNQRSLKVRHCQGGRKVGPDFGGSTVRSLRAYGGLFGMLATLLCKGFFLMVGSVVRISCALFVGVL